MKTKFGKINSIYDLFEKISERKEETQAAGWELSGITYTKYKCKMCGETIEEYLGPGVGGIDFDTTKRQKHIDFHTTIEALNINP